MSRSWLAMVALVVASCTPDHAELSDTASETAYTADTADTAALRAADEELAAMNARADASATYSASYAQSYAQKWYNTAYSYKDTSGSKNPWYDYSTADAGGNCTNFVSQAIIAGMISSTSLTTVFDAKDGFDIDASSTSSYRWYWLTSSDRGEAFTGAKYLHQYAVNNKSTYKGLHFSKVTNDTSKTYMDVSKVQVGDIVFADWTNDGSDWTKELKVDHSMIVTKIDTTVTSTGTAASYARILVSYQTASGYSPKLDYSLATINASYSYKAVFAVYRPTDYKITGL